ncbi:MAG: hypothetical protein QFX35_03365 [Candidatus Verstraetearchaeota archaeon]|nr:hypothetical protein [Candidatus Verstraetearchaeota archaeon]
MSQARERPFSSPASEVIAMLTFFWQEYRYQLLLVLGGIVEIDERLEYALLSGNPELEALAIEKLGMAISMSPSCGSVVAYLLKAFGNAMHNIHMSVQQPITVKRPLQSGDDMDTR